MFGKTSALLLFGNTMNRTGNTENSRLSTQASIRQYNNNLIAMQEEPSNDLESTAPLIYADIHQKFSKYSASRYQEVMKCSLSIYIADRNHKSMRENADDDRRSRSIHQSRSSNLQARRFLEIPSNDYSDLSEFMIGQFERLKFNKNRVQQSQGQHRDDSKKEKAVKIIREFSREGQYSSFKKFNPEFLNFCFALIFSDNENEKVFPKIRIATRPQFLLGLYRGESERFHGCSGQIFSLKSLKDCIQWHVQSAADYGIDNHELKKLTAECQKITLKLIYIQRYNEITDVSQIQRGDGVLLYLEIDGIERIVFVPPSNKNYDPNTLLGSLCTMIKVSNWGNHAWRKVFERMEMYTFQGTIEEMSSYDYFAGLRKR